MTREEAIKELKILKEDYWDDDGYGHETEDYKEMMWSLDMAIEALEQKPCEDCISRQAVLNILQDYVFKEDEIESVTDECQNNMAESIARNIVQLPSVTPQEPKTEWIDGLIVKVLEEVDGGTDDRYIRYGDICDRVEKSIREYCGAKMEVEHETD